MFRSLAVTDRERDRQTENEQTELKPEREEESSLLNGCRIWIENEKWKQ